MYRHLHCFFLTLAAASAVRAQGEGNLDALWRDPTFQRQFVGGYGINAEIEPRVTPAEVAVLEKLRPLMAESLPRAEAALREELTPECSAVLDFNLGSIQFQQDKLTDALASYQRATTKFPSFRRAWRNLGLVHARSGRFDEAIRAFTRMIELGGGDGYAFGLLGFAYAAREDFQAAEAAYRNALLLQPDNTEWRLGLTRCVFKQQKFEDAATLLDALLARFPDKADFWLLQAHTYVGMKRPLKAAENLELLAWLGKATADSQFTLGDIYLSENLPELAARAYNGGIDLDPRQGGSRGLRAAELLAARGAPAQARLLTQHLNAAGNTMDGARLSDPERRRLLKLEARLGMAEGDAGADIAAILEEIVRLDPLDGEALLLLGQHHAREQQPDRAMLCFERAAGIESCEANARLRHAQVLVGLGRYGDAVPLLRRVQELRPRDDVARYLEQVERAARARR